MMSEYIVKLPTYGAADEFFKTHEMPDMTLYGYPLTEEIVRCRDCVHSSEENRCTSTGWVDVLVCESKQWSTSSLMPSHTVKDDGFCAWGERKRP